MVKVVRELPDVSITVENSVGSGNGFGNAVKHVRRCFQNFAIMVPAKITLIEDAAGVGRETGDFFVVSSFSCHDFGCSLI